MDPVERSDSRSADPGGADAFEARIHQMWLRRRAVLGTFLIGAGLTGLVVIPILLASSDLGGDSLIQVFPGVFVSLGSGAYILRAGLPGDRAAGPVPLAMVARTAAWIVPIALLVAAWPFGVYRALWHHAALAGSPCEALLPIRAIETLGVRPRPIARVERGQDRCLVELAEIPGSGDAASLQLVVEPGSRDELARIARRARERATPLPSLGADAWRVQYPAGQRILVWSRDVVIRIQLARTAWSDEASDRLVEHLASTLDH